MVSSIYKSKQYFFAAIFFGFFAVCSFLLAAGEEISITTNSSKAHDLFLNGREKMENLELVTAAKLFDDAIKMDKNFALAHIYRALTGVGGFNVTRSHIDMASKLVDKVTEGEKNLILLSIAFIDGNQLKQKVNLDKLLTGFPLDKRVQLWAGTFFYTTKNFTTARSHLTKAIDIDRKFAPPYNLLGYTEIELNNMTSAEENFKKYISLIPNNPNPYDSYAEFLLKNGNYDESIKQYQTAFNKDNTFTNALVGIGNNYVFKNNFDEARKYYQKCFDASNNINAKLNALSWIATSYVHEGKIQNALEVVDKEMKLAKDNNLVTNMVNIYNKKGFILTESGMVKDAIEQFKKASELLKTSNLPPDIKEALTIQTDLNRCHALVSDNMVDEAQNEINSFVKTVNARGNTGEIEKLNTNLALIELKKGNYQTALNHLNKADTGSDLNRYYMGVVYQKMGNKTKAQECFTKVKNSHTNSIGLAVVRSRPTE